MKNKKGFTLIELLAIIVILAIIAVITVPIILNVIENAKKGSVIDSAYGYKDAVQKYYLTKSVNSINQELPTGTYNITALPSDFDVSGEHPSEGWVQLEKGNVVAYSLKFDDYVVTKTTNSEPLAQKGGEISENSSSTQNGTTVADITVSDYGQYVDLGTNILDLDNTSLEDNTNPEADWRIFLKDESGVWLILADYLPVGEGTIGASMVSTVGLETTGTYGVYSNYSRDDLVSKLNGDWSSLLTGSNVAGETGVLVRGAASLEQWVNSWNSNSGYIQLYTRYIDTEDIDNINFYETGYGISDSEPVENTYVDISSDSGYDNTLYFPHQSAVSLTYGYWLASPSASECYAMRVHYSGLVDDGFYSDYTDDGVRPVVYLPSSISLDTTNDVWTIVQ